jgi:hypothetical protein
VGTKVEARSLKSGNVVRKWALKNAVDFVFLLPDGKTVAAGYLYQSEEPQHKTAERMFVRLLDISSGAQREVRLPYQPREVRLSPAKAALALRHHHDSRDYLDILDVASGKLQRVTDDKTMNFWLLDFTPDGRRLYFSSAPAKFDGLRPPATLASVELMSGKIESMARQTTSTRQHSRPMVAFSSGLP